jgi:shikimate kinase
MKVTLIGMPGAGKSFVGARLARKLGYEILDIDRSLEEKYGKPLQQILDELGDERFMEVETREVIAQTSGPRDLIISPGGSIIYGEKAMQHLRTISSVVYLRVSFGTIERRIASVPRGIVGIGARTLQEIYDERTPLYERYSDIVVDANENADGVVQKIVENLPLQRIPTPL